LNVHRLRIILYLSNLLHCDVSLTHSPPLLMQLRKCSQSLSSGNLLHTGQTYGTITDTMDVIRTERNGRHLDSLEKYHIYKISMNNLHMDDTYNPIFQTLHELSIRQHHRYPQKRHISGNYHTERPYKGHMAN
jgi:hypothetical protein